MLATLLLSAGVPLLLGGDELAGRSVATTTPIARTTRSPGSTARQETLELTSFVQRLIAFRADHPVLRRREYAKDAVGDHLVRRERPPHVRSGLG